MSPVGGMTAGKLRALGAGRRLGVVARGGVTRLPLNRGPAPRWRGPVNWVITLMEVIGADGVPGRWR